jgi:hypothetical protein
MERKEMNSYGLMALSAGTDTLVTSNHLGDNHCNLSYDIKKLKKLLDRVEGDKG